MHVQAEKISSDNVHDVLSKSLFQTENTYNGVYMDDKRPANETITEVNNKSQPFLLRLGSIIKKINISEDSSSVKRDENKLIIQLDNLNISIPGLRLSTLTVNMTDNSVPKGGRLHGIIDVPYVDEGHVALNVDSNGQLSGSAKATFKIALLGNPIASFSYQDNDWQAELELKAKELANRLPIPDVSVSNGQAIIRFKNGQLSGSLAATIHHAALGDGDVTASISSESINGSGSLVLNIPWLSEATTHLNYTNNKLSGSLKVAAENFVSPIPQLTVRELSGQVTLQDETISGSVNLAADIVGLLSLQASVDDISSAGFNGIQGKLSVLAKPFEGITADLSVDKLGNLSAVALISSEQIPIPMLDNASARIGLLADGSLAVAGSGTLNISSVASGDFNVVWENNRLRVGADVTLSLPHMDAVSGHLEYQDGQIGGELEAAVSVGPLSGSITLRYYDQQFSGVGRLDYSVGRFAGWLAASLDNEGQWSGEGEATFRLTDWLQATIGLQLYPDMNVDAKGELLFPDVVEIFPRKEMQKNFLNFRQSFPLWGITIPVIGSIGLIAEIGANAGFRSGFGPGTLQNIKAEGEVSTRPDVEPQFSLSGDMIIPAGMELVLSIQGGIGLAALIAQITGGINLSGIAGIYGQLSLSPSFVYKNGEYSFSGLATLEAAAQLRAGISAYASIVAGIGWLSGEVWREDWNLAEWVFDPGWNMGIAAKIDYTLGQPFVPQLEFSKVDVDPLSIVRNAVPQSGDPVSGSRKSVKAKSTFSSADKIKSPDKVKSQEESNKNKLLKKKKKQSVESKDSIQLPQEKLPVKSNLNNNEKIKNEITDKKNVKRYKREFVTQDKGNAHSKGSTLDGITSNVKWQKGTLGGSVVGEKMTANPLGPDHIQGTPPGSGVQKRLMDKLVTDRTKPGDGKYIRGHLLNDNLGGKGDAYNLFPITANANKEHSLKIEKTVKKWVNDDKQWVSYIVEVKNIDPSLKSDNKNENYVNATFNCEASVLDPSKNMSKVKTIKVDVKSEFGSIHTSIPKHYADWDGPLPEKGFEARNYDVLLSTSNKKKDYYVENIGFFEKIIEMERVKKIDKARDLFNIIGKVSGIGLNTIKSYKSMIDDLKNNRSNAKEILNNNIYRNAISRISNKKKIIFDILDGI